MNEEDLTQEDIDEYNKRRQKEYDEFTKGNEEIRKKREQEGRQLDIPGLFEARSGLRTGAGLAFEVGANTALDFFSFIPPTQAAGSALINLLAQKIRGGEISKGEIAASAAASLIPGLAQGKAITKAGRLTRSIGKGGLSGAIETTGITTVDEGRLPTAGELATGTALGGAFGGAFDLAGDLIPANVVGLARDLRSRINNPKSSFDLAGTVGAAKINPKGSGDPEGLRSLKYQEGDILANTPAKNVKLLKDLNLTDDQSVFLLSNYYKEGSVTSTTISRDQAAAIESLYTTVEEFDKTKDLALPYFLKGMKGIKRDKTPQLDHIAQLKAALPFFNNAKVAQFPEITKIILEEGVFGLGHQRGNFKYLEFDVHTVKSNYFEDIVGNNGEIFFKNRDISTPQKLRAAAKEFAAIIDTSNNVVADAIEQYKFMNKIDISETELDEFVNILSKQPIRRKYSIKQVKDIFKQMEEDGFIQTPKESLKAEQAEVRSEIKEAQAKAKQQERLDRDASSVEKRVEVIDKFINQDPSQYQKTSFAFGMKDEDLRELAEAKYNELRRNRLIREDIQDDFFEAPKKKEAAIKLIMKSILNQQRRSK